MTKPLLPSHGFLLLLLVLTLPVTGAGGIPGAARPDKTIDYLLAYVAQSPLTFLRNAKRYSGAEAAEHMNRKYQHFRDDIRTAEDFIEHCATKSLMTGRLYTVITADGQLVPTGQWLRLVLAKYRSAVEATGQANNRTAAQPQAITQGGQVP